MKKAIVVFLLLLFVVMAIGVDRNPGDRETYQDDKGTYTEHGEREVIGFEPATKQVPYQVYHVNFSLFGGKVHDLATLSPLTTNSREFKEANNITVIRYEFWEETRFRTEEDSSRQGDPIYQIVNKDKIVSPVKEYRFDRKGCWVCGTKIACLAKGDGWSEDRAEKYKCDENNNPVIREGETGFVEDLNTGVRTKELHDGDPLQ